MLGTIWAFYHGIHPVLMTIFFFPKYYRTYGLNLPYIFSLGTVTSADPDYPQKFDNEVNDQSHSLAGL